MPLADRFKHLSLKDFIQKYPYVIAVIGIAFVYTAQIRFDTLRFYSPVGINISYNEYIEPQPLGGPTAKEISFGAREFLADWYWLTLIQYYGGGDPYGKYRKLSELFNTITDLSPKFLPAYQTGLLILPGEGFVKESLALGDKGEANLPDRWEIPYYKGLVYHIYLKDYKSAAREFEKAAALPDAPPTAKLFSGIYFNKADERQTAYLIFKTLYENTNDTFVKDRAEKYVKHLEAVFYLEDAVKQFNSTFHRNPTSLDELVTKRIIPSIPTSPLGISFSINASGAIVDQKQ